MTSFSITPTETQSKPNLLNYFRERGREKLSELRLEIGNQNHKKLASGLNVAVIESLTAFRQVIISKSERNAWSAADTLKSILASTYCAQVAMLDLRNEVWPYEYMAFSRRIGELWEHFVRIPFFYSVTEVLPFIPPLFSEVRQSLRNEIEE